MTNEKLNELNVLKEKNDIKKSDLKDIQKVYDYGYKPVLRINGCGVCELTPIELQMIKTRLQMEL